MFLKTPFPSEIEIHLKPLVASFCQNNPVFVRSSAIGEDSAKYSFAGIHESYVNVRGVDSILNHIKLVWASLYSDVAILYRQETGLNVETSKMAVILQQFINGQKSGVAFGKSPTSNAQMMIEAVYGLNQGLVNGTVEPDRWVLSRSNGRILSYTPSIKRQIVRAEKKGTTISNISKSVSKRAALSENEIQYVYSLCKKVENIFGTAQDTEWTYRNRMLYSLQSRPITALVSDDSDTQRQWYVSLKRSLGNLQQLRREIEQELIPQMKEIAKAMEKKELSGLTNKKLAKELNARKKAYEKWKAIYWDKFIPFAHAVRLFGDIRQMKSEDPYEFTQLLVATDMKSLQINRMLQKLAKVYDSKKHTSNAKIRKDIDVIFDTKLNHFIEQFRNPVGGFDSGEAYKHSIIKLLKQMAQSGSKKAVGSTRSSQKLKDSFVDSLSGKEKKMH